MASPIAKQKNLLLKQITNKAAQWAKSKEAQYYAAADTFPMFIRNLYEYTPPSDFEDDVLENLFLTALSVWKTAQKRKSNALTMKVYNPNLKKDGWECPYTVIEIVQDDSPFLVDSIMATLREYQLDIHMLVHPIIPMVRDDKGVFQSINENSGTLESIIHIQVAKIESQTTMVELQDSLENVLEDVRLAVNDWPLMGKRIDEAIRDIETIPIDIPDAEREEALTFMRFVQNDNFTLLGYREYLFEVKPDTVFFNVDDSKGLGLLRTPDYSLFAGLRHAQKLPPAVMKFVASQSPVTVNKATRISPVHRHVPLDVIGVKLYDKKGHPIGERVFAGLFTSGCYMNAASSIPFIRRKISRVFEMSNFDQHSHSGKRLRHILESFPRDELFQISVRDLYTISMGLISLHHRPRLDIFIRKDLFQRYFSCMVFFERDKIDTRLRKKVQSILEKELGGKTTGFYVSVDDNPLTQQRFIITHPDYHLPDFDIQSIRRQLRTVAQSWNEKLYDELHKQHSEEKSRHILERWNEAFPLVYQEQNSARQAIRDMGWINTLAEIPANYLLKIVPPETTEDDRTLEIRFIRKNKNVALFEILPILRNMGVEGISERSYTVTPSHHDIQFWVHQFQCTVSVAVSDTASLQEKFEEAFNHIWDGAMDDDGLNRLVLAANLNWREVTLLRTYCLYLKQIRIPFSQRFIINVLCNYPHITHLLCSLFEALHNPKTKDGETAHKKAKPILKDLDKALESVSKLDDDRLLRAFIDCIKNTLRTNFYQREKDGGVKNTLSIKLLSRNIGELPLPKPYKEIFIYSTRFEGVHLRSGKIARGGIRWSDRHEDFRTEILGLMKAQTVKNTVIIPTGSKGGFICKKISDMASREEFLAEGISCYTLFINALLDVTDNLKNGTIIAPPDTLCHDPDDPYLVVAADKGTATFSDTANAISADHHFWMDDAFASGGSHGYDHKKMGITARGAWESVKHHFYEMGKDIQTQEFTCVGVGDMSGDVFGNGMLLSPVTKLIAAFDHRHIFIDPNPDAQKSFAERQRLFNLPRSSWDDYNRKILSKCGMIVSRNEKTVTLTGGVKKLLNIAQDTVSPPALMQKILMAQVDLLWFGGIGTYVKAIHQSNDEVGDKANDALRINGRDIRAKVVGEGANLGCTQLGRIEYAHHGGRINTDFIDNSAGVNTSDHEVNLKILLSHAALDFKKRNTLLSKMEKDVAALVLEDNKAQALAISLCSHSAVGNTNHQIRLMKELEKSGLLNRIVENLPDDDRLAEMKTKQQSLTRPELAILLSYAKISLYQTLLESDVIYDSAADIYLHGYFPQTITKNYGALIQSHPLRNEIVATCMTNHIINTLGATYISRMAYRTGERVTTIVRATLLAFQVLDFCRIWDEVNAQTALDKDKRYAILTELGDLVETTTLWFLKNHTQELGIPALIDEYRKGIKQFKTVLGTMKSAGFNKTIAKRLKKYPLTGKIADDIAILPLLGSGLDSILIANNDHNGDIAYVTDIYFMVIERFKFREILSLLEEIPHDTVWTEPAFEALRADLFTDIAHITANVLRGQVSCRLEPFGCLSDWIDHHTAQVQQIDTLVGELLQTSQPSFEMFSLISGRFRSVV